MLHPQKRIFIKKVLESTILRICEIKRELVLFNTRPNVIYVHLDQLLFDLKYDPSVLEIPVPRYFREHDCIPLGIKWKEEVERKKKKKKPKKNKKKPKTPEPKSPRYWKARESIINQTLKESSWQTDEPEQEIVKDPFTLDMDIISALRLIQKSERGRQCRERYIKF